MERFIIDIGGTVLISKFNDETNIKDLEINVPEKEEDNKENKDNNKNDSNEGNNNNDSNNNNSGKNTKKNNKNDNNLNDGKQVLVLPNKLLIILFLIYILN